MSDRRRLLMAKDPDKDMLILKYHSYNVKGNNITIQLFNNTYVPVFDLSVIKKMWINGEEVTPTYNYTYSSSDFSPIYLTVKCYMPNISGSQLQAMFHGINSDGIYTGRSLLEADFTHLDLSDVTNISSILRNTDCYLVDFTGCNLNNVTNMDCAFMGMRGNTNSDPNINSSWNGSWTHYPIIKLRNCGFSKCTSASSLFSYSKIESIGRGKLYAVDITGCRFNKLTNTEYMFSQCTELKVANLSGYRVTSGSSTSNYENFGKITSLVQMFDGCANLKIIDLTNVDLSAMTNWWNFYAAFRCNDIYDTDKYNPLSSIYYNGSLNTPDEFDPDVFGSYDDAKYNRCTIYVTTQATKDKFESIRRSGIYTSLTDYVTNDKYKDSESYPHVLGHTATPLLEQ